MEEHVDQARNIRLFQQKTLTIHLVGHAEVEALGYFQGLGIAAFLAELEWGIRYTVGGSHHLEVLEAIICPSTSQYRRGMGRRMERLVEGRRGG